MHNVRHFYFIWNFVWYEHFDLLLDGNGFDFQIGNLYHMMLVDFMMRIRHFDFHSAEGERKAMSVDDLSINII